MPVEGNERIDSIGHCRGSGDGMQTKGTKRNTGSLSGDRGSDQPATRESQAGPYEVAGGR